MNAALLLAAVLAAAVDPAIRGAWEGDVAGVPFSLVVGDGSCTFMDERVRCSAKAGRLVFHDDEEGDAAYAYRLEGGALVLSGDDLPAPLVLRKRGGAASPPPSSPAPSSSPPAAAPRAAAPAGRAAPPQGPSSTYAKEAWGAKIAVPGGWRAGEKDGMVLLGSDVDAGLIVVRFFPTATRAQMIETYQQGLHENGVNADPTSPPVPFDAKGGQALAGELSGTAGDGTPLRIRTVGVLTPHGGALSVVGLTTPDQYATLAARVDAVARGTTFTKPPKPKAGALAGDYQFIHVSKSGIYSREASLRLCRSGRFQKRGEMAGAGGAGSAVTWHGDAGTWTATGDASAGTLTLTFDGGGSVDIPYQTSTNTSDRSAYGAGVRFGSDLYQKTGAGDC